MHEAHTDVAGGRVFHDRRKQVLAIRRKEEVDRLQAEYARKLAEALSDKPVPLDTEADRLDFGYFSYTPPLPVPWWRKLLSWFVRRP